MWVMEQSEDECFECVSLGVYDNKIVAGVGNMENVIAGTYKSKERAKEIVKSFMLSIQNGKTTFWMPKE